MAIYIKAIKVEENEDTVIYNYGHSDDNLKGLFVIRKDLSDWKHIKDAGISISGLIGKICAKFIMTKSFPDEISYQA